MPNHPDEKISKHGKFHSLEPYNLVVNETRYPFGFIHSSNTSDYFYINDNCKRKRKTELFSRPEVSFTVE